MSTPRELPDTVKGQVTEGFAEAAGQFNATGSEFFTQMGARLADTAGIAAGAHVLDAGCGTGAVTIPAAQQAGPRSRVIGIDLARPMLEQARAAAGRFGIDWASFQCADAETPPYPSSDFDVVLAGYVIQLLPNPEQALVNWLQLLRPGGRLAFSWGLTQDPAWRPVMAAVDAHLPDGIAGFDEFYRRLPFTSAEQVEKLLQQIGYEQVSTTTSTAETIYHDPAEWWAVCKTQAPWIVAWQHIPAGRLAQAERDAYTALQPIRGSSGEIRRRLGMAITTADRPDTAAR